jgi:hypothetical protein
MAGEIGAAIDLETAWVSIASVIHHPYSYSIFCLILNKSTMVPRPELLLVNLNGERWMLPHRGSGGQYPGYNPFAKWDLKTNSQTAFPSALSGVPGGAVYAIADSCTIEILAKNMVADEIEDTALPILARWREEVAYEAALDDRKGTHGNHTKKADTLDELALKMDIDPKVFLATMERYNKLCDDGIDLDFGKDPATLIPIRNPPYYAFWAHRFSQMSHGGIVINDNMEVLDTKGNVMSGLFAAGSDTTNMRNGHMERAQVLGWLGGTNAAKYLKSLG